MNIMIVCDQLTDGGAGRVAVLIADGFASRGHEVTFLANLEKNVNYRPADSIRLLHFLPSKGNKLVKFVKATRRVRRCARRYRTDVIVGIMELCSFISWVATRGMKIPVVATEHNAFERPTEAPFTFYGYVGKYYANRLYSHITVLTQADKDVIGRRLKHVTVLPNPLALKPIETVPPKEKIVLAVGRKDAWYCKGFDVLIRAWAQVVADTVGWRLQIVGGSAKGGQEYLEQLCREFGVEDSVEFSEFQSDILPYYRRASIFVLSSRYEGFGLVLIEAMSQGCACIACDYKGRQGEIVTNGVDGMTCEPDDVEALAGTIRKVIADNELRKPLQAAAIRRAGDFGIDRIMEQWEKLFKEIIIRR